MPDHRMKMYQKTRSHNKNSLKILIRTAGGKETNQELGLGHIFRCLNLAKEMRPNKISFLLEDFGGAKKIIQDRGFHDIKSLKKNIQVKDDISITKQYLEKNEIDLLVVDRYNVKIKYLKEIKKYVKLVVISDLKKIEYPANLVVNGFIGLKNQIKNNSYNSKCILGPKYQILDKRFSKNNNRKPIYDLLVTLGGYDEKCFVDLFLQCLKPHITKIRTKVIIGPVGKKSKLALELEKKNLKNLKIIQSTKNMMNEISSTRIGICNGGITSYEFASMKKYFGIICVERHQYFTAKEWEKKGLALNLGIGGTSKKKIELFLENIVKCNLPDKIRSTNFVDGKGASRVSHEILKIGKNKSSTRL